MGWDVTEDKRTVVQKVTDARAVAESIRKRYEQDREKYGRLWGEAADLDDMAEDVLMLCDHIETQDQHLRDAGNYARGLQAACDSLRAERDQARAEVEYLKESVVGVLGLMPEVEMLRGRLEDIAEGFGE